MACGGVVMDLALRREPLVRGSSSQIRRSSLPQALGEARTPGLLGGVRVALIASSLEKAYLNQDIPK